MRTFLDKESLVSADRKSTFSKIVKLHVFGIETQGKGFHKGHIKSSDTLRPYGRNGFGLLHSEETPSDARRPYGRNWVL